MLHNFTVTFRAKYLTGIVTSVPPYETFSFIKKNILRQSKISQKSLRKLKFLRYVTCRSCWSCDMLFISTGIFDDKLRPQILSVVPIT
jgi:hypothetical protein